MKLNCKALLLCASAFAVAQTGFASDVTWTLQNVTFDDSATASGTFTFDADSNSLSNWNISVTGGSLAAYTYDPSDSTETSFSAWGSQPTIMFSQDGTTRQLRMTPVDALTDAGGIVNIDLNTSGGGSGSVECDNCYPYREITGGSFDAAVPSTATPEPASMGLVGLAFATLGLIARKSSKI